MKLGDSAVVRRSRSDPPAETETFTGLSGSNENERPFHRKSVPTRLRSMSARYASIVCAVFTYGDGV